MRGKGVTEGVRGHLSSRDDLFGIFLDHRAHVPLSDPATFAVVEQRRGRRTFPHRPAARMRDVPAERVHARLPERNQALFPALPEDPEARGGEVHIFKVQRRELADTDPGPVQDLEERSISGTERIVVGRQVEQPIDLERLDDLRERTRALGRRDERRGIVRPKLPPDDEPVIRAQAGRFARDAGARVTERHPLREETPDRLRVRPQRVDVKARAELDELREIAPVRGDGVRGQVPFAAEVSKEILDGVPRPADPRGSCHEHSS